jgi:hypothetical protein
MTFRDEVVSVDQQILISYWLQAVDLFLNSKDAFEDILQPRLPNIGSQERRVYVFHNKAGIWNVDVDST